MPALTAVDLPRRSAYGGIICMYDPHDLMYVPGLFLFLVKPSHLNTGVRSPINGAIPVEIRLAVALRVLAGGSYWDAAVMFGLAAPTVYFILWQVIDAINKTPGIGEFYFPQDEATCLRHAERFKVGLAYREPPCSPCAPHPCITFSVEKHATFL